MALADSSKRIIDRGEATFRVKRAGMLQSLVFRIRRVPIGRDTFVELYADRVVDMPEIARLAEETGLPVEAQNGRAFPSGKGAKDFICL